MILPTGSVDKDVVEINEQDAFTDKAEKDGVMRWNVMSPSDRPNSMRVNWNIPRPVRNAVLRASDGFQGICQYPEAIAREVK